MMEDRILRQRIVEMHRRKGRRVTAGAMLIAVSLVCMELAVLILLGIVALDPVLAVFLIFTAPFLMAFGLYFLMTNPNIRFD